MSAVLSQLSFLSELSQLSQAVETSDRAVTVVIVKTAAACMHACMYAQNLTIGFCKVYQIIIQNYKIAM